MANSHYAEVVLTRADTGEEYIVSGCVHVSDTQFVILNALALQQLRVLPLGKCSVRLLDEITAHQRLLHTFDSLLTAIQT